MKSSLPVLVALLLLPACQPSPSWSLPPVAANPTPFCGDRRCEPPEDEDSCSQDCGYYFPPYSHTPTQTGLLPADGQSAYWVTNPTSGARLYVQVFYPDSWDGSATLPALLLMPGGIAASDPQRAARLAGQGYLVIIFDADGRGRSQGAEDYNGYVTQDGLAAVLRSMTQLPGLDPQRFGLVSYSYGVTAATGALNRYPDLPVRFYIDWEGPVDRNYTTTGCQLGAGGIPWQACSYEAWWAEREAIAFIGGLEIPYQRIQSEQDHVQPDNRHALEIVNAAVASGVPWVRLNEDPPNRTYDTAAPPAMLPEELDRHLERTVARYATDILENVLPGLP